ncbi:MAG: DUF72 domain-containing protein [Candidatus Eremiobacteraeota bacterium]|nr:DUF72 domain-containing protein [Candidatus Eremiobacteraeota bacterium]
MIYIGTCGYSYKDWVGPFYPKGVKNHQMLPYYARHFSAVEIDATYYNVFSAATFSSMDRRTPDHFKFCAKLPGSATHLPKEAALTIHDDVHLFRESIQPLVERRKFVCALMQFPNSFKPDTRAEEYIRNLRAAIPDIQLVAEFRNREWQSSSTIDLLTKLRIGWCNVDGPQFKSLMRPGADVTSEVGYVRFHGRNYDQWWRGDNVTRYDYLYSAEELKPWTQRVTDVELEVKQTLAFFNNHRRGQAVVNAEMFEEMLRTQFGDRADRMLPKPKERTYSKEGRPAPLFDSLSGGNTRTQM